MLYLESTLMLQIKKLPNQKHPDYDFFAPSKKSSEVLKKTIFKSN